MSVEVHFLGHATFLIKSDEHAVLIDPFLDDNPKASIKAADVECTHIVVTHAHADHFADCSKIAKRTGATVFANYEICEYLGGDDGGNLDNLEPMNHGGRVPTPFGYVALVQAFHSSSFNGLPLGEAAGTVINIGGKTIYHAGDTALFSDMKLIGELYIPQLAILPVGDRFTMGPEQATQAAELVGAQHAIPCHYGTWPLLRDDISTFKPIGTEVHELTPGESMTL
ncbi:MAG: metal-dependent hydrolase [Planctomycetota bacterium]